MILSLGYKSGSGKDTVGSILCQQHGFYRCRFSFKLKQAARQLFNLTEDEVSGDLRNLPSPVWGITPREILQELGAFAEKLVPNYTSRSVDFSAFGGSDVAFTDMRTISEADATHRAGGFVIRIDRENKEAVRQHYTETQLDDYTGWDYILDNNGSLEDLEHSVSVMLASLRIRELQRASPS